MREIKLSLPRQLIRFSIYLVLASIIFTQSWYNHPELEWQTIESEHFYIHFHIETERSARETAEVAEFVYGPITSLYQFEPDSKTHIIIKDTDDYSNGAAYFYDNKIEIWALPLDFDLRGAHRWIQDVVTHEFTHIVQVQASMKFGRRFPAGYFQWIDYEEEKREDVLYGYPNILVSTPIPGVVVPPWLAEGTAQFMYAEANFDYWDAHRDMILRDRVIRNNLLTFEEMNTFGKRGIGNESTYNQGFSFVKYLVNRFGSGILRRINDSISKPLNYSIYRGLKDATGVNALELYDDWKSELESKYVLLAEEIESNTQSGIILESGGTTNIHPVWSPNEARFAFLSNRDNDYFGQTDLFIYSFEDSTSEKIMGGVQTAPMWLDDTTLIYARRSKPNQNGSKLFDLYKYEIPIEEETRLTEGGRLTSPIFIPNDNKIAAITTYDGTSNIVWSFIDTINFIPLTEFTNGTQIFSLEYDESRNSIWFDAVDQHTRSLFSIDLNSKTITENKNPFDERDPTMGSTNMIFATDKSGIFNLYNQQDGINKPITNVTGGAFMPDADKNGRILYSLYENGKYNIAMLNNHQPIEVDYLLTNPSVNHLHSPLFDAGTKKSSKPYEETMPTPFIFPRIMVDYGTVKPGFYFYTGEVLDKLAIMGGASLNNKFDKDLFLLFEFKKFQPTLYANIFGISRKENLDYDLDGFGENSEVTSDIKFSLFEADIGLRYIALDQKFWFEYVYQKFRQQIQNEFTAQGENFQFSPFGFDYFRGHFLNVKGYYSTRKPEFAGNMLPSNGYEIDYKLSYENNQFMSGLDFEGGVIQTEFEQNNTFRFEGEAGKHWALNHDKKIVASAYSKIGLISNRDVDDFFHFFGGGLPGIKGYTFYDSTLTGTNLWVNTISLRIPIFLEENYPVIHLNLQNLTIGGVLQVGGGFNSDLRDWIKDRDYKISGGIELRLSGYSFYVYPVALSYEYHTPISDPTEVNGKSYFSILFDF